MMYSLQQVDDWSRGALACSYGAAEMSAEPARPGDACRGSGAAAPGLGGVRERTADDGGTGCASAECKPRPPVAGRYMIPQIITNVVVGSLLGAAGYWVWELNPPLWRTLLFVACYIVVPNILAAAEAVRRTPPLVCALAPFAAILAFAIMWVADGGYWGPWMLAWWGALATLGVGIPYVVHHLALARLPGTQEGQKSTDST